MRDRPPRLHRQCGEPHQRSVLCLFCTEYSIQPYMSSNRRCYQHALLLCLRWRRHDSRSREHDQIVFTISRNARKGAYYPRARWSSMGQRPADYTYCGLTVSRQSAHASDYHPQLAVGASDGSCLTTNTLRSTRRGGLVVSAFAIYFGAEYPLVMTTALFHAQSLSVGLQPHYRRVQNARAVLPTGTIHTWFLAKRLSSLRRFLGAARQTDCYKSQQGVTCRHWGLATRSRGSPCCLERR